MIDDEDHYYWHLNINCSYYWNYRSINFEVDYIITKASWEGYLFFAFSSCENSKTHLNLWNYDEVQNNSFELVTLKYHKRQVNLLISNFHHLQNFFIFDRFYLLKTVFWRIHCSCSILLHFYHLLQMLLLLSCLLIQENLVALW